MGKKKSVAEARRIQLAQTLEKFRESKDEVYTFDSTLSNKERALVHRACKKMGMKSKSSGRGSQRRISIYKIRGKVDNMKGRESLTNMTFSEGAQVVLQDLFTHHPPEDGELGEKLVEKYSGKTAKVRKKKDDIFSKPLMSDTEIAEKVKTLASRIEKDPNLRQINEERSKLPIASFRDVITSTVESHQVVLISGETGCGKTTQVPQYLLDYMWGKGEACKVVCTQPRRISATSVSERISNERGENVGNDVGYKIRLESKGGRHSSIVFCTNGVLLRVLVSSSRSKREDISDMTHIIMDEIHERDRFCDFMLAIIRDILPSYPHLRLVLMSATLDAERFSQYFGGCPIIRVPGFTYPVKAFYLEDVLSILKSADNNHLISASASVPNEDPELTEEDKIALDEAINLACSTDEFDPLLELVSVEGGSQVHNYQHSLTGLTPLMVFAGKGRVADVCMLLSFGVNCHLRSKDGKRALEWAEQENQQEATEIIKKHMQSLLSNSGEQQQLLDKYIEAVDPEIIDVVLIEQLLRKICIDSNEGAILVFLPGWEDINRTREKLLANPFFKDSSRFIIISLHSMVPSAEQKKVFKRPPFGCRKIILSTNIAESSITIDDVVYVIDSGRMKEKSYDPYNNVSTLQSSWVSKANAKQREGRAGRCQPGTCYHLYSKLRSASMPDFQVPEIKRMPIEELCLQVKLLDPNCKVENFLQKTLDPPVSEAIRNAVSVLQDIGAFSHDEELTELGEKLGYLPVHPLTSKMLFFAILMNCLDPALTLACTSEFRDPFVLPMFPNDKKKAAAAREELASLYGGQSDQLAVIAAFECWKHAKERGQEGRFCSKYFISSSTMNMLFGMRKQLQAELMRFGFIPDDVSSCSLNAHDPGILHAVLVAGFYPMVGRLLPLRQGKRFVVETAGGSKVRLHTHSINSKLSLKQSNDCPLIMYDEITRGDGGMHIRNCTVIGPLPLLLLATEIAVAPAKGNDDNEDDDDDDDGDDDDGSDDADECDTDGDEILMVSKSGGNEKVMSSPDNSVMVVVDRWLSFRSTALDVAQIYCLRERLSAAILSKVLHPRQVLTPVLGASIYAIACILSYDGLSGISTRAESVDSLTLKVRATEIDKPLTGRRGSGPNTNRLPVDRSSSYWKAEVHAYEAVRDGTEASSCNEQAPVMSVGTSLRQASSQGPISVASGSGMSKLQGQGPREGSCKRRRRGSGKKSKQ
ncbi:DExH-box ATP-dependent RNA helicase DExH6-like isoform X1 [Herrania umbratica]|uniref:DExH-box ATP-dependent RNA helicase DExH6-like isoform X1 n=2 Tax=Herrania umbratica TaxID=108875 RepID=A0A6J1BRA9_9ROSI|nr:DExH-box ATP-dependent RNA helicase DExH6-like isoform X1 [Herrania umbratica]